MRYPMQKFTWKFWAATGGLLIAIALVFYAVRPRTSVTATSFISPAFSEYIASYSAGMLRSNSTIRLVFTRDVADSSVVGKTARGRLFRFSPSVQGEAFWVDARTVEFRPAQPLPSGQKIQVSFTLSQLFSNLPANLEQLNYVVQVVPQNFEVSILNVKAVSPDQRQRQVIEGEIQTADVADAAAIEKMVSATQQGKALPITWTHTSTGSQHLFTITDVQRFEGESKVTLSVSGSPLNVDGNATHVLPIPALGDFKVTQVRVEQGSAQHVVVQFSDPLSETQNLNGLVSLRDVGDVEMAMEGNELRIYPPVRQNGTRTLQIEQGIRNVINKKMAADFLSDLTFDQLSPAVRFTGKGNILPGSEGLVLPFEAVNLRAVDVQVIRVFQSNVLQFFQANALEGDYELRRVGRPVVNKTIALDNTGLTDIGKWNRFTLDLGELIAQEPGAIYQVRLAFRQSQAVLTCDGSVPTVSGEEEAVTDWNAAEESNWDPYYDYYYGDDYDWEQRDNPCHASYYNGSRTIKKNIVASDLGLLAKCGEEGTMVVVVNDLKTTQPLSGVKIEAFDFQLQPLASASTASDGKAVFAVDGEPFLVVATSGVQRGYLRVSDGDALSMSEFNVGGSAVAKGIKGFLYGERGVWRPGDSLYLTFILEDKGKTLPPAHPVIFELQNPQGHVSARLVKSVAENGFYSFATATDADAPTGNWQARVKVGGTTFTEPIKIETIKPNRLKINLDFGVDKITTANTNVSGNLNVNWLHGAPGKNLRAVFDVTLVKSETKFQQYPEHVFEDPTREFYAETRPVFDGYTDASGFARVNAELELQGQAPGRLNALFRGKVFEESGNFSIDQFAIPFYPYESYTGIRLPKGDAARGMLLTDTTHRVDVVTVDADGQPLSRTGIELSLYKIEWRWWWDASSASEANYMSDSYSEPVASGTVNTVNGKGAWRFRVKYPEWGRFLVRAYDPQSGHSTAKVVYIDWPGWAGRARNEGQGATMLSFSSDKPIYQAGEKARIVIPGSGEGRALVSIENGSQVLATYWTETKKGDNIFSLNVEERFAPNVFVNVTLLQPHAQTLNDLPMRLYGVIPIQVENPKSRLQPVISLPKELEPGGEVRIRISEKENRKMTYTVAVVDEGLLDITRFATPDAWSKFYAREALGVKTWDIYDQVIGAYGNKIERLLAVGGAEFLRAANEDDAKSNRFKPVVKFFGPYTLAGGSRQHTFTMPAYIGSVKTMVVAGYEGAYGKAEQVTPVRKPLMVLATLPRVLGPEENLRVPITVFANEKSIRQASISLKVKGPASVLGPSAQVVEMPGSDATVYFNAAVRSLTGKVTFEVAATAGAHSATDVVTVEVRHANPPVTRVNDYLLEPGKEWSATVKPVGMEGTNSAMLEVSTLPPVNLGQRLRYLMQYPYGCLEQTTSSVFPQLYLDQVKVLSDNERATTQRNIKAGIERLKMLALREGGFAYWPGAEEPDSWGTSYAGHFLLEAGSRGYLVPADMLKRWKKYQREKARGWRNARELPSNELLQAYRLYTLALAGEAELSAMNRLREMTALPPVAGWMLAAAYARAGQPEAARAIIANLPLQARAYQEQAYSYGSQVRDEAIILETLLLLNDRTRAFEIVKRLSESLSNANEWLSTQSTAWALKAVGLFAGNQTGGELKFSYALANAKEVTAATALPVAQVKLSALAPLKVKNLGKQALFVRVIAEGIPSRGSEQAADNNLRMDVGYTDIDGNALDPATLEQGQEFVASVRVAHPGVRAAYKNLALAQIFPSGWEVNNLRLTDAEDRLKSDTPAYQDIRDDRVYTYFDLRPNETKTFRVLLTASYAGQFYLPAVSCEAMYDRSVYSRTEGREVTVSRATTP